MTKNTRGTKETSRVTTIFYNSEQYVGILIESVEKGFVTNKRNRRFIIFLPGQNPIIEKGKKVKQVATLKHNFLYFVFCKRNKPGLV